MVTLRSQTRKINDNSRLWTLPIELRTLIWRELCIPSGPLLVFEFHSPDIRKVSSKRGRNKELVRPYSLATGSTPDDKVLADFAALCRTSKQVAAEVQNTFYTFARVKIVEDLDGVNIVENQHYRSFFPPAFVWEKMRSVTIEVRLIAWCMEDVGISAVRVHLNLREDRTLLSSELEVVLDNSDEIMTRSMARMKRDVEKAAQCVFRRCLEKKSCAVLMKRISKAEGKPQHRLAVEKVAWAMRNGHRDLERQ